MYSVLTSNFLTLVIQLARLHGVLRKAENTRALCYAAAGICHVIPEQPCSTALLFANTADAAGQSTVSVFTGADHLEIQLESTASGDYWTWLSMKGRFVPHLLDSAMTLAMCSNNFDALMQLKYSYFLRYQFSLLSSTNRLRTVAGVEAI